MQEHALPFAAVGASSFDIEAQQLAFDELAKPKSQPTKHSAPTRQMSVKRQASVKSNPGSDALEAVDAEKPGEAPAKQQRQAVANAVASASLEIRMGFLRKVYLTLLAQMALSFAIIGFFSVSTRSTPKHSTRSLSTLAALRPSPKRNRNGGTAIGPTAAC